MIMTRLLRNGDREGLFLWALKLTGAEPELASDLELLARIVSSPRQPEELRLNALRVVAALPPGLGSRAHMQVPLGKLRLALVDCLQPPASEALVGQAQVAAKRLTACR